MFYFLIIITNLFLYINFLNCAVVIEAPKASEKTRFTSFEPTSNDKLLKEDATYWNKIGEDYLEKTLNYEKQTKKTVAKNVIIFVGDGMGIPTITAARIYKGQREFGKSGEDHQLVYEKFPNVALVKTYNVDMQVPDSAGTATALFTGVKTRYEAIGVDIKSNTTGFNQETYHSSRLESIMSWAQKAKKHTGIITTTRITHATPACTYSQVNTRKWECDSKIPRANRPFVKDIARQLIEDLPGRDFRVILGGGYQQMGYITEDLSDGECVRSDGLNLTKIWTEMHANDSSAFVLNNGQLEAVGDDIEYLLGLFYHDHLPYELLRDKSPAGTPSLKDLLKKGLKILKKSENGFVLLVEGGRIDHGHHHNLARIALEEASQFDDAIAYALEETNAAETLILVTADHSHTMTINGYSQRGMDILGYGIETEDEKPALTLSYANGPGFAYHYSPNNTSILGPWIDVRFDENRLTDPEYQSLASFEVEDESHGGEDVAIFGNGPGSHLIRGVFEQNYVAHMISYTACIGPRAEKNPDCSGGGKKKIFGVFLVFTVIVICLK